MNVSQVFLLFGGIALFLFGMKLMGDGLKMVSGGSLAPILYRLTGTPLRAILLGTGVTAVLQSSCATSVMAVGFANSGMMKLRQAVGVILGSILGTSVTGWIVCLSYIEGTAGIGSILSASTITGAAAAAGVILRLFCKKTSRQHLGDILLGFAVLMLGMSTMSGAARSVESMPWFSEMLTAVENPVLGILTGALFTAILQSASASVGILQALSAAGGMTFAGAFPMLLGAVVGASVPVLLSAVGANADGKRAALVYPLASLLGVAVCYILYAAADGVFHFPTEGVTVNPFSLAALNTLLRLAVLVVLVPFMRPVESLAVKLVRQKKDAERDPMQGLDPRFLNNPGVAIDQCRLAVADMAALVRENLLYSLGLLTRYSGEGFEKVAKEEELADRYEDSIGTYIVQITTSELTERQNEDVYRYLHAITDLERISDHAMNIAENAREIDEKAIPLGEGILSEMEVMKRALTDVLDLALKAMTERDFQAAYIVEPLEECIDNLCAEMHHRCLERLTKGVYTRKNSFVFNDLIANYERVSDHCSNLAIALIELERNAYDTHDYLEKLMEERDREFDRYYRACREKYSFD